jgi:hypothetical protein
MTEYASANKLTVSHSNEDERRQLADELQIRGRCSCPDEVGSLLRIESGDGTSPPPLNDMFRYFVGVSSFFCASLPVAMPGGVLGAPGVPGAVEAPGVDGLAGVAAGPIGADPEP